MAIVAAKTEMNSKTSWFDPNEARIVPVDDHDKTEPSKSPTKGPKRKMSVARADTLRARKEALESRVDLVEYQLGKFMFSHTGMSFNEAFGYFDKDSNDELDKEEIEDILKQTRYQFTEDELQMLMDRYNGGITVEKFKRSYHVERKLLLDYAKEKEEYRVAFAEIPVIFLFFSVFVLLLYGHDFTETKYDASTGVLGGVLNPSGAGTKLIAVRSTEKVWSWLENEFLDHAFVQNDAYGEQLPRDDWGYISQFNKYVGPGVYLSQRRSVSDECRRRKEVNVAYGQNCNPSQTSSSTRFGPPTCGANVEGACVESNFTGAFTADSDHAFTALLDYKRPRAELKHTIKQLRKYDWIDKSTTWLEIKYHLLNLQLGTYTQVILQFEFSRGGRVTPTHRAESSIVNPYAGALAAWGILDALWIAFQIYTIATEGRDLCEDGWREYCRGAAGAWNSLDWLQIVITFIVAGIWFTIVGYLSSLLTAAGNGVAAPSDFVSTIETIEQYNIWYKLFSVVNLLILVTRFFKGFAAQPRLAIVVESITRAAVDLAHWFIIFVCLLLTFVMLALFLFGHRVESFAEPTSATFQLFRGMLVVNALPVKKFMEADIAWTYVWYLLYIPLMVYVMQPMVLAIILGSFRKTRIKYKDARTFWAQASDVCVDMIAVQRKLMKLSDVIDLLENPEYKLSHKERVNFAEFLKCFRNHRLLSPAQDAYAADFVLSLMEEFFVLYDRIRMQDMQVRSTNAYARITQLDDDFLDLNERLGRLENHADEVLETIHAQWKVDTVHV